MKRKKKKRKEKRETALFFMIHPVHFFVSVPVIHPFFVLG